LRCQNCLVNNEQPEDDGRWDPNRTETETERLDRNWSQLLQELRVAQTGVQVLTGFLLTLPFQQRFTMLDGTMRNVYLVTAACSIASTGLLVAPVGMHRLLFRRHRMKNVVASAHRYAITGLLLLAISLAGVATVIFDAVAGPTAAWIAGGCALVVLICVWFFLPLWQRGNDKSD
jgi:Family of unknown function (DUF6328)